MMSVQGKYIWLIGASTGIGEALAKKLASQGAILALSARSKDKLDTLNQSLGGVHRVLPLDVANSQSMYDAANAQPQIDIIIFNAGTYTPMTVDDFDLQTCLNTIDVNLNGAFRLLDAVLPMLRDGRCKHLVMVSSVAAYRGMLHSMAYGASKAALTNLVETLRVELAPRGVKIQLVSPGFVKTPLTDRNHFKMPMMISPERAAEHIARGIDSDDYEIHFPKGFTLFLKLLRILPSRLYFWLVKHVM